MTSAEKVGEELKGDGMVFKTVDGRTLEELCEAAGARRSKPDNDSKRFDFKDGSSIIAKPGAWDYGMTGGCGCWAGDSNRHAEECTQARRRL
jgi:hypothetical protein